jgi:hypothetical protein
LQPLLDLFGVLALAFVQRCEIAGVRLISQRVIRQNGRRIRYRHGIRLGFAWTLRNCLRQHANGK